MLVLKQMIPQKKVALSGGHPCPLDEEKQIFAPREPMLFAMSLNFPFPKSWVSELSSDISFVSVLVMVLSEYWKRLEEIFWNKIISAISQNGQNYKNIFLLAFFNILKESLVVQKKRIPQNKDLILSYLELESLRAWHNQEGTMIQSLSGWHFKAEY